MAGKPPRLTVSVSRKAQRDLDEIWDYNARSYRSADHADAYLAFLEGEVRKLETDYLAGKPVPDRQGLQYVILRKGRGHGHLVVYEVVGDKVEVLGFFHTRQDWQSRMDRPLP